MSTNIDTVLAEVDELLLSEESILVQLRIGAGLDHSKFERLLVALRILVDHYKGASMVPKRLALAFVDISNYFYFDESVYPEEVIEELEDCAHQLTAIASELFEL